MENRQGKVFNNLRDKLSQFKEMETSAERHIFLLWIITRGVTLLGGERPILVGGGAVEVYTGIRFATGDLDIVAPDKKITMEVLDALDFELPINTRHYVNRSINALVEIHGSKLKGKELPVELSYKKVPLLLVSPEDCIADRLAGYRKHGSTLDFLNAFLVSYHQEERLDAGHLAKTLDAQNLWDFYRPIQDIGRDLICDGIGADEAAASLIHFMKKGTRECAF